MAGTGGGIREILIFVGLGLAAGCAGNNDGSKDASPIPTAPAVSGPADGKPKAAELPERPEGAGEYDPDVSMELMPTGSGLYYRILRKGDGKKPTIKNAIVAHYKGWLDNGSVFDSSYESGRILDYPLEQLVKGWQEGLPLIGEGGMIELEVPPELGYGSQPKQGIPPGSTLHFILELKKVK